MKLLILLASVLFPLFSQAQVTSVKTIDNKLVIKMDCASNCLYNNVVGMQDTKEQTIARSKKDGSAIQYILYSPEKLKKLGLDKKILAQEINDMVKASAMYFKKKPEFKGTFITDMTFYPGYRTPFQFPLDKVSADHQAQGKAYNEALKNGSSCNDKGFCGALSLENIEYIDSSAQKLTIEKNDYLKFINTIPKNEFRHFPTTTKPEDLIPLKIILVVGTNGYHVEKEDIQKHFSILK